jgi:hypothetical protein
MDGTQPDRIVSLHGVRAQVTDVARAAAFYTDHLGFKLEHQQLPVFASMDALKNAGVKFRNQMEVGPGGRQIQIEDPDGIQSNSSSQRDNDPVASRSWRCLRRRANSRSSVRRSAVPLLAASRA